MALPKEPRQKMINIMYLVLTALLALNVSSEVLNAFRVVDKSLIASNGNIEKTNGALFESFKRKMADPKSVEKATIWNGKAEQVKVKTDEMVAYINKMKSDLIASAAISGDTTGKYKEDDLHASTVYFVDQKKGDEFKAKLEQYRKDIFAIDPMIAAEFEKTLPLDLDDPIGADGTKKEFSRGNFGEMPAIAAVTLLTKFENNVRNVENQVVAYCHSQIGDPILKFDQVVGLASQSTKVLRPGETMDIEAGLGAFNNKMSPSISIGGSSAPVDAEGIGRRTITADGSTGDKSVDVIINYVTQSGEAKTFTKKLTYTVFAPSEKGDPTVAADKMNVFYAGVPNPVSVASPDGWEAGKTSVGASGPISLSGGGGTGKYIVTSTASSETPCTITVNGKSFPFRVLPVPNPAFMIGNGNSRQNAAAFAAQDYCRAELTNFIMDGVKFEVISADAYFLGNGFPRAAGPLPVKGNSLTSLRPYLDKCIPGSTVGFENIKVKGPAGDIRTLSSGQAYQLF